MLCRLRPEGGGMVHEIRGLGEASWLERGKPENYIP